jgi:hypothetical protein
MEAGVNKRRLLCVTWYPISCAVFNTICLPSTKGPTVLITCVRITKNGIRHFVSCAIWPYFNGRIVHVKSDDSNDVAKS